MVRVVAPVSAFPASKGPCDPMIPRKNGAVGPANIRTQFTVNSQS